MRKIRKHFLWALNVLHAKRYKMEIEQPTEYELYELASILVFSESIFQRWIASESGVNHLVCNFKHLPLAINWKKFANFDAFLFVFLLTAPENIQQNRNEISQWIRSAILNKINMCHPIKCRILHSQMLWFGKMVIFSDYYVHRMQINSFQLQAIFIHTIFSIHFIFRSEWLVCSVVWAMLCLRGFN